MSATNHQAASALGNGLVIGITGVIVAALLGSMIGTVAWYANRTDKSLEGIHAALSVQNQSTSSILLTLPRHARKLKQHSKRIRTLSDTTAELARIIEPMQQAAIKAADRHANGSRLQPGEHVPGLRD